MVPQLTYPLVCAPDGATSVALQLSSAKALRTVISVCAPRMHKWKGDILSGVFRCWVTLVESGAGGNRTLFPNLPHSLPKLTSTRLYAVAEETIALRETLQGICQDLAKACPSVVQVRPIALCPHGHSV